MRERSVFAEASVDPPSTPSGVVNRAPDAGVPSRASAPHQIQEGSAPLASAWDVLAGQPECESDLLDYMRQLDESPELRSAATLRSLDRLRDALERIPESAQLGDPVTIRLQDALLIARQMLSRLR